MNAKIEALVKEIRAHEELIVGLHRQLGEMVADEVGAGRLSGKMTVAGPAPTTVDIAAALPAAGLLAAPSDAGNGHAPAAANDAEPPDSAEHASLRTRLVAYLNANPGASFTANEAAVGIGDDAARKTVYTMLRRAARAKQIVKAGRGTFRAIRKNGKSHGKD